MAFDYSMRISRLTVDKLGVKLYDKVSAVIAELIANAYDADATEVTVSAPMNQYLASRSGGSLTDLGFEICIKDNGIGMTPEQVQEFFLVVGAERRDDPKRGGQSPGLKRKVMGRKGVGKLAPFGICKTIEVISSGGDLVPDVAGNSSADGYLTSHIILDYDAIVAVSNEPDERYLPSPGDLDESLSPERGTRIILKQFNYRKVPTITVLRRQLAQRFGIRSKDWQVQLHDNTQLDAAPEVVGEFDIDTMPNTRIEFRDDERVRGPDGNFDSTIDAGFDHNGTFYPIVGWMAYSKAPYKDELMAGVRIYCRQKIAAQTTTFNRSAGFTGEHNIRSYLVGELHADWLDQNEDLIQTDRRDILWSDELGVAFENWGQEIVRRIGYLSRDPLRKANLEIFWEVGDVENRLLEAFPTDDQEKIRNNASEMARSFGRTISRGEVDNQAVVNELVDLIITLAPHVTLNSMMTEAASDKESSLSVLGSFLHIARIAELSSFGRIAANRLKVVKRLELLKHSEDTAEADLQKLITEAPWLINPEWAPVTQNQSFSRLRKEFEKYYETKTGQPICLSDFRDPNRRPEFVLSSQEGTVHIIEIKKPGHTLTDSEMDRIIKYYVNMRVFFSDPANAEFGHQFHSPHVTLVCDNLGLTDTPREALKGLIETGNLTHLNWAAFLLKTERVHQDFLAEAKRQQRADSPQSAKTN